METIDTTERQRDLGGLLHRIHKILSRFHQRQDHAHHAQFRCLAIISQNTPMRQNKLQEMLDVRSSSLSELLQKLEKNGLITRCQNENDRRSYVLSATEKGRMYISTNKQSRMQQSEQMFACLSEEEKEQLEKIFQKIIASIALEQTPEASELEKFTEKRWRKKGRFKATDR